MNFRFGKTSLNRLDSVHPDMQRLMHRALELTTIDFSITQGKRTLAQQQNLYAKGRTRAQLDAVGLPHIQPAPGPIVTWTLKSNHLSGNAVDVGAFPHGVLSWNERFYAIIAQAIRDAAIELKIPVIWGGIWDRQLHELESIDLYDAAMAYKKRYEKANPGKSAKLDFPHFELASSVSGRA